MPPPPLLLLGLSLLVSSLPAAGSAPGDAPTAYDVLERYGFPRGLLPDGVESYLLREDGAFDVYLGGDGPCEFAVAAGYTLRYRRRVTGRVEEPSRAIRDLKGVRVRVLRFLWLAIGEVVREDDQLRFRVGPLSASFPVSDFQQCPRCRRGFHAEGPGPVTMASLPSAAAVTVTAADPRVGEWWSSRGRRYNGKTRKPNSGAGLGSMALSPLSLDGNLGRLQCRHPRQQRLRLLRRLQ